MKFDKTSKLLIFIFIFLYSIKLFSYSWPIFVAPPNSLLLKNIERGDCPYGQGKLKSNVSINIKKNLCQTFCPESWSWHGIDNHACHDLNHEFELLEYKINHVRNSDNVVNYTKVVAHYGQQNSNHTGLQFIFISKEGEHWECVETGARFIICANDI